jgi:hypothetical protein
MRFLGINLKKIVTIITYCTYNTLDVYFQRTKGLVETESQTKLLIVSLHIVNSHTM